MVAGGTGITPMLQLLRAMLAEKGSDVKVSLLVANRSPEDILCADELQQLSKHPNVDVAYTVDRVPDSCNNTHHTTTTPPQDCPLVVSPQPRLPLTPLHAYTDQGEWQGLLGYITPHMLARTMPPPASPGGTLLLACGPPVMLSRAVAPAVRALGYAGHEYFQL